MDQLVSIISPCYNGEKYVEGFLKSVLYQTYPAIELIFIDDASTDETQTIVNKYIPLFEKRGYSLIYRKLEKNSGQAAAINVGLKLFSGEYITWMDSDDIYYPEAIRKKVQYLVDHQDVDFVLNRGDVVNESDVNTIIGTLKRMKPHGRDMIFKDLLDEQNAVYAPGTYFTRSASFREAIPDLKIFESREGQNWQLMLPLVYAGKVGYLEESLFMYVVHGDSHSHVSRTYEQMQERRYNFYILQKATISKIPQMPEDEKEYWLTYIYNRMLRTQLRNAIHFHKYADYHKFRNKLLQRNVELTYKDNFMCAMMLWPLRKTKTLMKRFIKGLFKLQEKK